MSVVFSIIIPVYNVEKYISQCLQSVIDQTFVNFEAICVDDCGNDNSVNIIKNFMHKDSRIKLIHHKTNRGLSASRNTALAMAQGEYIVCLDSDDWLEVNCLEVIYKEFQLRKTNSIWFDAYNFDDFTQSRSSEPLLGCSRGYLEVTPNNIANFSDYTWIKAYKKTSITDYKILWPEGLTFEDGEFYFKYFLLNPNTYIIDNCLYNYRSREGSIVQNAKCGNVKIEHIYQVIKNIRKFYIEQGLYEKYKIAIMKLMNMRINSCKNICNQYSKSILLSDNLIQEFGFPSEFKEFDNSANPIFSVIVPIYNVEQYIEKSLKSIQSQSLTNFEILCVDDCGNDNSMKIVENLSNYDKRIKIIRQSRNLGNGAARNRGLREAKGRYIICVDPDDWLQDNHCFQDIYDKFLETDLNMIWYKWDFWWEKQKRKTEMFHCKLYYTEEGMVNLDDSNLSAFPMYSWNKAYKRSFLIKNNILWSERKSFTDMIFGFKAGIISPQIYLIDKPYYVYRRHSNSIIGDCITDYKKAANVFKASLEVYDYLKNNNLLSKYKNSFLRYSIDNINMFRNYPNIQKKLLSSIKSYIEKIDLKDDIWTK